MENESVTVGTNYTVRNVDTAAPTRPDWVTTELPHPPASMTANGMVIALSHTGGRAIQLVANLFLETPTRSAHTLFLGSLEPGDTWYRYLR